MNRSQIYKNTLLFGNKEIVLLITRSLMPIQKIRDYVLDETRLSNELYLFRHLEYQGNSSILSSLIPAIIIHESLEKAEKLACEVYIRIRKKMTLKNKIGINLLCCFLDNLNKNQSFSNFVMLNASKEEQVAFQKEKIEIILEKKSIKESILENLAENDYEFNNRLLESLESNEEPKLSDDTVDSMLQYYDKLSQFAISPPKLKGNINIEKIFHSQLLVTNHDPLIGDYKVIQKNEDSTIVLECKRGSLTLKPKDSPKHKKSNVREESHYLVGDSMGESFLQDIGKGWESFFLEQKKEKYFQDLLEFIEHEFRSKRIFPSKEDVFKAYKVLSPKQIKVVIIGQDPYHGLDQANGLCFSVNPGVKAPPSLQNIFKELFLEYGVNRTDVDLKDWAEQGVMLLNAVLTVEEGKAGSHANVGWEKFTDRTIEFLNKKEQSIVFLLWGNYAIAKGKHIDTNKHLVLTSVHPSPLSSHRGFFGNNHFKLANEFIRKNGHLEIKWV